MAELKAETLIDRPVEEVMSFLGDLTNHPAIMPAEFGGFSFPGRTAGKGALMRAHWQRKDAVDELLFEVVRQDENDLVMRSSVTGSKPLGLWYWVQGNERGSYVKLVVERPGGGGFRLFRRRSAGGLEVWRGVLPKLKQVLEPAERQGEEDDQADS
jgi:hypothetical protein